MNRKCTSATLVNLSFALTLIACMLFIAFGHAYQWVDGAWNAQVADVFARTGRYAVSYPQEEAFYVPITTGQTVLLPVALVYRIFGVSQMSSAVVPLLYMSAAVLAMLVVFRRYFAACGYAPVPGAMLSGSCTMVCFFFYSLFGRYAHQVLGEGAALAFLMGACLMLGRYTQTHRGADALLCGGLLACALITKTVTMCFIAVFGLLILLECFVTRRFSVTLIFYLAAGFAAAFCALEAFKLVQLDGSIGTYLRWWKSTLLYSFGLSSDGAAQVSGLARILDNLRSAADLFTARQIPALLVMLLIAPMCYLVSAASRLMKREDPFAHPARFALLALGLGGDGFVVASILFTSSSMFAERRMLLHGVFFLMFVLAATVDLLCSVKRKKRKWMIVCSVLCVYAALCAAPRTLEGGKEFLRYDQSEDAQRARDVHAFSEAVAQLPPGRYYGCGWIFAAETMLMNGLRLYNLEDGAPAYAEAENHYLLVESYPLETDLSAEHHLTPVWRLRENEETYSIYRIEPVDTKE